MHKFIFPEIICAKPTIADRVEKVESELAEYKETPTDDEMIDILHAVETLMRLHFNNDIIKINEAIVLVFEKNLKRGYY